MSFNRCFINRDGFLVFMTDDDLPFRLRCPSFKSASTPKTENNRNRKNSYFPQIHIYLPDVFIILHTGMARLSAFGVACPHSQGM